MRVRVLKDHSSPIGSAVAKHKGDEFTVSADEASAHIAAGNIAEVRTAKRKPKAPPKPAPSEK